MLISVDPKIQIQALNLLNDKLYTTKTMTLSLGIFLIGILGLSCLSTSIFKQQNQVLAQSYVQTIKYRNLVIDLSQVSYDVPLFTNFI